MYLVGMELRGPEIMGSSLRGGDGPGNIVEINTWVHLSTFPLSLQGGDVSVHCAPTYLEQYQGS